MFYMTIKSQKTRLAQDIVIVLKLTDLSITANITDFDKLIKVLLSSRSPTPLFSSTEKNSRIISNIPLVLFLI